MAAPVNPISSQTPTREFRLIVNPDLLPFTDAPRKGFTSFQMKDGRWFNTRRRSTGTQELALKYAKEVEKTILDLVKAESRRLQNFWHSKSPQYFNRRSYGMYFSKKGYKRTYKKVGKQTRGVRKSRTKFRSTFGKEIGGNYLWKTRGKAIEQKYTKNRPQFAGRARTGQLRRALTVKKASVFGSLLFVKPCYASTGGKIDYVTVLMYGASASFGHPYVPAMDRRPKVPRGYWRGIKDTYWKRWQHAFQKEVNDANERLNKRISDLLVRMKHLEVQDARRISAASRVDKNINKEQARKKSRKGTSGKPIVPNSPYNKGRTKGPGSYNKYIKRDPWRYKNDPYAPNYGPYDNSPYDFI